MRSDKAALKAALGFLTVVEHEEHGLFGGYLVLNMAGRPLEFHCTAPLKPNRAQEILFGPTLDDYLFGEQIGLTLLDKAASEPLVVCTDCPPVLAMRGFISVPVVLVLTRDADSDEVEPEEQSEACQRPSDKTWRLDAAHSAGPRVTEFRLGPNRLAVPVSSVADRELISKRLDGVSDSLDLMEPFGRIREAIDEARHGGQ